MTPVVLFFVLDRSGAINDTSPVAALVVAVTYGTILAGSGQPALPSQVTGLWAKLLGDVDKIQASAQARMQLRVFDYLRGATDEIAAHDAKSEKLLMLAHRLVDKPKDLDATLARIAEDFKDDPKLAMWKKAEALMRALNVVYVSKGLTDEVHVLLRREKLITWQTYMRFPGEQVGSVWRSLSVFVPAVAFIGLAVLSTTNTWNLERSWWEWRLSKTNVTAVDLTRTREALIERIQRSQAPKEELQALGRIVREVGMTPVRVEAAIGIMTDSVRPRPNLMPELVDTLIVSLRTPNVDGRSRIHSGLIYLAAFRVQDLSKDDPLSKAFEALKAWKPSDSDFVTDLAARIDDWQRFFARAK